MNGKRTLPFGLLTIAVVLALALMGVAYALWSETLSISGTVSTGAVDVAFQNATDDDDGIDPGYDKNVADCTVELGANGDSMTINITNGYPSYTCTVSYEFFNSGTIPVILNDISESIPPELTVMQTGPEEGYQLDANQHAEATIAIHVDQEAEENENYTLSKSFWWVQWNEYPQP